MLRRLIFTTDDTAALVLRVMLGAVFFPHGAQKALGWFGGYGFTATVQHFTDTLGVPYILVLLVIAAEFLGSIGLIVGFLTRLAAFGIFCVMTGAIGMVHWQNGLFMNWSGNQAGEGFEYHLLAIAITLALMLKGGGKGSIDKFLSWK